MCVRSTFRMRNLVLWLLWGASMAALAQDAPPADATKEARQFLLRYAGLTSTSDVAVLELYRDDARIRVTSYLGERQTQAGVVRGTDWKGQLRAGWYDGTSRLEASSFQDASVVLDRERLVIRARRYSQTGCYWDNGYAVAIVADRTGQYQIAEERISFQRASSCPTPGGALAQRQAPAVPAAPRAAQAAVAAMPTAVLPSARPSTPLPPNVFPIGQGAPRPNFQAGPTPGSSVQP